MAINRKALADGRSFEDDFAQATGAKLVPASGATPFAKLDVDALAILFSLKSAPTAESYRLTAADIREVLRAVDGPNGKNVLGAMAIRFNGIPEDVAVIPRMSDFFRLLRGEIELPANATKGDVRRRMADTSLLARGS